MAGCETTFNTLYKEEDLYAKLREIADSLAEDLARTQFSARTVTLTYKPDTFERLSRAHTAGNSTFFSTADELYAIGKDLLDKELHKRYADFDAGRPVKYCNGGRSLRLRLLGLRGTNLRDESDVAVAKRGGKASITSWAKQAKTPSPKRKAEERADDDEVRDGENALPEIDIRPEKRPKLDDPNIPTVLNNTECPICARKFAQIKLAKFNRHIDQCLQGNTVSPPAHAKGKSSSKKPANAFAALMKPQVKAH